MQATSEVADVVKLNMMVTLMYVVCISPIRSTMIVLKFSSWLSLLHDNILLESCTTCQLYTDSWIWMDICICDANEALQSSHHWDEILRAHSSVCMTVYCNHTNYKSH